MATRSAAASAEPEGNAAADRPPATPAAALARHIEWLEYALGAATAEETVRAGRVEKATKKNREKRTARLAEVHDEVVELSLLLAGIKDLQATAGGSRAHRSAATRSRATTKAKAAPRRRGTPASSA